MNMKQQVTFGLAMAAAMCGMALRADDEGWTKGPDFSFDTRAEKTIAGTAKMITYSSDGWGAGGWASRSSVRGKAARRKR